MAVGDPAAFVEGKSELLIVVNSAGHFFIFFVCLFFRCAAMTTVQRITAQLLLLFPQGHSFVP